jgi:hypothetical protein
MIKKPEEMTFSNKKFSMLLYGAPGVGKTTLALSAPDPIIIDFDRGMSRVKAQHRKTAIFCDTYEEVLTDIKSPEVSNCQTLIIDTGGSFVTFLQDWAMRTNPTVNRQKNGAISLKGFGAVKSEFSRFTSMVKDVMNKNIIYVFHSQEQQDKDGNAQQRLMCEGAAKNIVWTPCDFGGYVQMIGDQRVICFSPEQEFFAKGCHGINGKYTIPNLGDADSNDFLTRIFDKAKANIEAENEAFAPIREQYDKTMIQVQDIIENIVDAETANVAVSSIPALEHVLTSEKEARAMLKAKTDELGLKYTKSGGYVPKEA